MSHIANLVLVDEQGYKLFYCHWCANEVDQIIFWGPEFVIDYIHQQVPADKWQDEVWAEAGILLDTTRKTLLIYGGSYLEYDLPLRKICFDILGEIWPGWNIRWAHNRVFDLVDYVNVPRDHVLAWFHKKAPESPKPANVGKIRSLEPPFDDHYIEKIGSIRFSDNSLRIFPSYFYLSSVLMEGPALLNAAKGNGVETLSLTSFPNRGFHIDEAKRELSLWASTDLDTTSVSIQEWADANWQGWHVLWLEDNYRYQLEQTGGALTFPQRSDETLIDEMKTMLFTSFSSGAEMVAKMLNERLSKGDQVYAHPYALQDSRMDIASNKRQEIFEKTVAAWQQRKIAKD